MNAKTKNNCQKISKIYNVSVYFKSLTISGYCNSETEQIFIDSNLTDKETIYSVLLHELGHVIAKREGKYPLYHQSYKKPTKRQAQGIIRTAYRAEKYVDMWAEKEFYKLFPNLEFQESYRTEAERKWLIDEILKPWYKKNWV